MLHTRYVKADNFEIFIYDFQVKKTPGLGFCLFGTNSRPSVNPVTVQSNFLVPSVLPSTRYVTATRAGRKVAIAQAPLHQVECLTFFRWRRRLLQPNSYSFHICGARLLYSNGLSIVLGQYGECFDSMKILATVTELKIWIFEDEEDFHIKGLQFHFDSGAAQAVGIMNGSQTKTFQNFVSQKLLYHIRY